MWSHVEHIPRCPLLPVPLEIVQVEWVTLCFHLGRVPWLSILILFFLCSCLHFVSLGSLHVCKCVTAREQPWDLEKKVSRLFKTNPLIQVINLPQVLFITPQRYSSTIPQCACVCVTHPLFFHLHTLIPLTISSIPYSSPSFVQLSFFSCHSLFISHFSDCTAVGHGRGIPQEALGGWSKYGIQLIRLSLGTMAKQRKHLKRQGSLGNRWKYCVREAL